MAAVSDAQLREILSLETVAVVGCSTTPGKDARQVPQYLIDAGYTVVPVNPTAEEIFGRRSYPSLGAVEDSVDIVNIFRPSEEVAAIVTAAIDRDDVRVVWTQQGIRDAAAAQRARAAGISVVQDRCMRIEHSRLFR